MHVEYKTIAEPARGSCKEKGSKFFSFAFPVVSEEEISSLLEDIRQQYHDARHHCFAYRLGADGSAFRTNDDGEPANTAGKPILGQIDKYGFTMVLVVVVRYFGGTLLGASGLARAYKTAAADALERCKPVKKFLTRSIDICFAYEKMNGIMRLVDQPGIEIHQQDFTDECHMVLWVRLDLVDTIREHLKRMDKVRYKVN